ncbi:MAG: motility associated factor glycosyltransferase family protein [Myxococcota bacterium]
MHQQLQKSSGGQRWSNLVEVITVAAKHMEECIVALQARRTSDLRRNLDAMRRERARLTRLHRLMPADVPVLQEEQEAMTRVRRELERIKLADQALDLLMPSHLKEVESAAKTPEEIGNVLIDGRLGRAFDLQYDLTVLLGKEAAAYSAAFHARGYEQTIVVIEPDAEFDSAAADRSLVFSRLEGLEEFCSSIAAHAHERTVYVEPECAISPEFVAQVKTIVSTTINTANSGRGTRRRHGGTWARHCIANLPRLALAPVVSDLSQALADKPAIIVCPGPSLKKSLDSLREVQGRAVIIAVNHALHNLANEGITPDFAIALDPSERLIKHFEGIDLSRVAAIILANSVSPELFRIPGVDRYMRMSCNAAAEIWLNQFLAHQKIIDSGGTIAHAGAVLAQLWGCNPIVLVGQDLAYTGGQVYAEGTAENRQLLPTSDARYAKEGGVTRFMLEVDGWNGERISTSLQFHMYRRWYESWVASLPNTKFFNCSEGGAYIKGMTHVPLAEIIEDFQTAFSVATLIEDEWDRGGTTELQHQVLELCERRKRDLEAAKRIAKRCHRLSEESRTQPHKEAKLKEAEAELREVLAELPEVGLALQKEVQDIQAKGRDLRALNQAISASTHLFERIESTCRDLELAYREAIREMRALPQIP